MIGANKADARNLDDGSCSHSRDKVQGLGFWI